MPQYQIPLPKPAFPAPPPDLVYGAGVSRGPSNYQIPLPKYIFVPTIVNAEQSMLPLVGIG